MRQKSEKTLAFNAAVVEVLSGQKTPQPIPKILQHSNVAGLGISDIQARQLLAQLEKEGTVHKTAINSKEYPKAKFGLLIKGKKQSKKSLPAKTKAPAIKGNNVIQCALSNGDVLEINIRLKSAKS